VTVIVSMHSPVCGVASSFEALTTTVCEPDGSDPGMVTSAVAVPPMTPAGTTLASVTPAGGVDKANETTRPSASEADTCRVVPVPASRAIGGPQLTITGSFASTACVPRPLNVLTGNPSHSAAGSKTSVAFVSPASIKPFRRSVLSCVLTSPEPHSVPGSKPIWPIASTT
jgi:hypothetical protein